MNIRLRSSNGGRVLDTVHLRRSMYWTRCGYPVQRRDVRTTRDATCRSCLRAKP